MLGKKLTQTRGTRSNLLSWTHDHKNWAERAGIDVRISYCSSENLPWVFMRLSVGLVKDRASPTISEGRSERDF